MWRRISCFGSDLAQGCIPRPGYRGCCGISVDTLLTSRIRCSPPLGSFPRDSLHKSEFPGALRARRARGPASFGTPWRPRHRWQQLSHIHGATRPTGAAAPEQGWPVLDEVLSGRDVLQGAREYSTNLGDRTLESAEDLRGFKACPNRCGATWFPRTIRSRRGPIRVRYWRDVPRGGVEGTHKTREVDDAVCSDESGSGTT
jgi:hypothetical protein